ncbi:hypothetical protein Acsp03_65520 [Actinomadura sp. NBRC 104412]|uniref:ABC transporter substrate-binding protein n=1 Tax=Actinomadura sp. NBRC 104412 TaxID=3032203 RepID=UPI0024A275A3|nr:ABC transporter substrate-binding protein [Actinomadura sp. NBRC 104412]GLZ09086.1 hypothetical protein Acsp03_65520 [Actinomadura sp. NBRC 104412]
MGGLVVAAVLAVAGCGGGGQAGGKPLTKLTYRGPFVTSGADAPLYYAAKLGYYEQEGLEVEIRDSKGSTQAITDVGNGGSDVGMAAVTNLITAVAQGQQVTGVATVLGRTSFGFFVPKDSGIASIKDLRGKSIAVTALVERNMYAALAGAGLAESDVRAVVADPNALITTYVSGKVDAMYTVRHFAPQAARRPSNVLMQSDAGFNPPDYALIVSKGTLGERPEVVRGFVRATLRGFQAARRDPEAAIDAILAEHPQLDRGQSLGTLKSVLDFMCSPAQRGRPYGESSPSDWSNTVAGLRKAAGLQGPADGRAYFDNSLFTKGNGLGTGTC